MPEHRVGALRTFDDMDGALTPGAIPGSGTATPTHGSGGGAGTPVRTTPPPCPPAGCEAINMAAVNAYLGRLPGTVGIVIRDRVTGHTWRAGRTDHVTWTASTIKLAIATSILERERAGQLRLTATDRTNLARMLQSSDNASTDALWTAYGADSMVTRFRGTYGMTGLVHVAGDEPAWRGYACNTEDLLRLVSYVLDKVDGQTRAYLVGALRTVAANQHWGVWAAGTRLTPGNKNGWAQKPDPGGTHWVTRSVGFAGPNERYEVAVSDSLPPGTAMSRGVQGISDLVALAFGVPTPARVTMP